MARATVAQVNSDLKEHLAQCHEQSKTVFNTLQELKSDLKELNNKIDVAIYATTGFLATTLVAILLLLV
jgi:primosomal protein N''